MVSVVRFYDDFIWTKTEGDLARDYMATQEWAKENTKVDALFAQDPSMSYGWRDFSQRSSFGNTREWGYTSIAYLNDDEAFLEGRKRLKDLGVDLTEITDREIAEKGVRLDGEISLEVKRNFYTMTDERVNWLAQKYGIDYYVLRKSSYSHYSGEGFDGLEKVYENSNYAILKTLRE